jgi:hypothetical protein
MNRPRLLRGFALATLLATLPMSAYAGDTIHETSAFKVKAPDSWELNEYRVEKGGKLGSWSLTSPSRNRKLYVHVRKNSPRKTLKQLFNEYLGTHLRKRVRHLKIQSYQEKDLGDGAKMALGFVAGVTRRNKNGHIAKFGVMVARKKNGSRVVSAALGGTKEGWGGAVLRFETILGSIDLK